MPYLGHENFREVEVSALSLQHKASQTTPMRKVFRALETSVAATSVRLRDNIGSQALYLPIPTTGNVAQGALVVSVYAQVGTGAVGTVTGSGTQTLRYNVTDAGVVTFAGTALVATINSGTFTVTANNTVTGVEIVVAGLTIGTVLSAVVVMEIYPFTPIEETYGYVRPGTAALTTIEGVIS